MANKEKIELWANVLESDEFKQGRGLLRLGDKFCCLGVACELYRRETGRGRWSSPDHDFGVTFYESDSDEYERLVLPNWVASWLELTEDELFWTNQELPNLNDGKKKYDAKTDAQIVEGAKSFKEIAQIIREELGS